MNVAVPRAQQSWMFGQRASSHTVCRRVVRHGAVREVEDLLRVARRQVHAQPLRQPLARATAAVAHADPDDAAVCSGLEMTSSAIIPSALRTAASTDTARRGSA